MKLEQSFTVAAPSSRSGTRSSTSSAWRRACPGAEITGQAPDGSYEGNFTVKLGPTTASYRGSLKMDSLDEASRTATMHAKGTDKRGQGGANASIVSDAAPGGRRDGGRRRHRLHDHRPPGALRARRDDRGHLQADDARLLAVPAGDAALRAGAGGRAQPAAPRRGRARDARRGGRRRRGLRRRRGRRGVRRARPAAAPQPPRAAAAAAPGRPSRCTASGSCSPCCGSASCASSRASSAAARSERGPLLERRRLRPALHAHGGDGPRGARAPAADRATRRSSTPAAARAG